MIARLLALSLSIIGLGAVTYGVALIYVPAAWMFAGGSVALFGLLAVDVEHRETKPPPKTRGKS